MSNMIEDLDIEREELVLKKKLSEIEIRKQELENSDSYAVSTNTAFLENVKMGRIFEGFGDLADWLKIKHEQHWKGKNDSIVEITFKLKNKKELKEIK